jgi:RNA polymerase sigma factor (sigma-70 family)
MTMVEGSPGPAELRASRELYQDRAVSGYTDGQLVERFVHRAGAPAEAAFAALVARHGPMVMQVCRALLRDAYEAEDAFQATFLVLARRASSIRQPSLLANWLYGVALRTARKARGKALKRQSCEVAEANMGSLGVMGCGDRPDVAFQQREQTQLVHYELKRLPENERAVLVCCYLEDLTVDEAARRLGCTSGVIRRRLANGRAHLRTRLVRRGMSAPLACASIAAALSLQTVSAARSSALQLATVRAALSFAARNTPAMVSPGALQLALSVTRRMIIPKLVISVAGLLFVGVLFVGHSTGARLGPASDEAPRAASGSAEQPAPKAADEARDDIVRAARGYALFRGPDRVPLELEKEPILRWPNPTRGTHDGATFLWTRNGRPEAIACVWKRPVLSHAFQSLSMSKLVAEYRGQIIWHPEGPGFTFERFPKAPRPAESPVKRMRQMGELARRFQCRVRSGDHDVTALRLLPRPVYRYKIDPGDLVDGALFAYVLGTDPEVILSLEAQRRAGESEWRYALTRRSAFGLEADLDGERIWSVPTSGGSPEDSWFHADIPNPN